MQLKVEKAPTTHVPEGTYPAKVDAIEEISVRNLFGTQDEEHCERLRWVFLLEGEHEGAKVSGLCSKIMNELSHLYKWVTAAMGKAPSIDSTIETDDLIGKRVTVKVQDNLLGGGNEISNVVDVLPVE